MEIQEAIACFAISQKTHQISFFLLRCCWKRTIRLTFKACSWNTSDCPVWFIQLYLNQINYLTSITPMLHLSIHHFSILCYGNTWHTLTSPSAGSNQTASGFLETRPVCKTQTHSAWYSFLSSSYPFLFCHLSTSPHCGNPSQVRTKWVTQGGSQLEHTRPCIRYRLDSAPTWAYERTQNALVIWQALWPGMI